MNQALIHTSRDPVHTTRDIIVDQLSTINK